MRSEGRGRQARHWPNGSWASWVEDKKGVRHTMFTCLQLLLKDIIIFPSITTFSQTRLYFHSALCNHLNLTRKSLDACVKYNRPCDGELVWILLWARVACLPSKLDWSYWIMATSETPNFETKRMYWWAREYKKYKAGGKNINTFPAIICCRDTNDWTW